MELLLFKFLPLSGVSDKDTGLVAAVDRQAPLQATFTLDLLCGAQLVSRFLRLGDVFKFNCVRPP